MAEDYERLRRRIAALMNRLAGQCWTELVCWALPGRRDRSGRSRLPWRPIDDACRRDAASCGVCYCGKLRAENPSAVAA